MEPDAAPCMHAFDYHPVCYFIFNIIIMHLTMIICPTSSTTLWSCIWLSTSVSFSIYDFINVNIMPQKDCRLQHLDVVLGKQTIASNQRLLLLPGLAMMTSQVLEFYSIFSAHYQHYTAFYWSAPKPSCCWTFCKWDEDPNKARLVLVQALGDTLFCAFQLLLNTEVKATRLLQPVHAHHHWEQGQRAILPFASIVYSHPHWQPNCDADAFW